MIEQLLWSFFARKHQVTVNSTRIYNGYDDDGDASKVGHGGDTLIDLSPLLGFGLGLGGFGWWQIFGGWKLTSFSLSRTWGAQAV